MLSKLFILRPTLAAVALLVDLMLWGGDTDTRLGWSVPFWLIILIAAVAYSTLALPGRPLLGYCAMWLISLGALLIPSYESFIGFLVALFSVARWMPTAPATMALVGAAVPVAVNTLNGGTFVDDVDSLFIIITGAMWSVLFLATWAVGRALARGERRLRTQQQWAEEARNEAVAVERLRISRELHDIVAHSLTAIVLQAAGARTVRSKDADPRRHPDELDAALAAIQTTGSQSMRELHRLLGLLRHSDAGDVDEQSRPHGIDDVDSLLNDARASGLSLRITRIGVPVELDPSTAHTAYRVVQEGLSNAMKYAGTGARVEYREVWAADALTIAVLSSGTAAGPAAVSGGFGIVGLRERVAVSGGALEASPTSDGFLLQARLPAVDRDVPGRE